MCGFDDDAVIILTFSKRPDTCEKDQKTAEHAPEPRRLKHAGKKRRAKRTDRPRKDNGKTRAEPKPPRFCVDHERRSRCGKKREHVYALRSMLRHAKRKRQHRDQQRAAAHAHPCRHACRKPGKNIPKPAHANTIQTPARNISAVKMRSSHLLFSFPVRKAPPMLPTVSAGATKASACQSTAPPTA